MSEEEDGVKREAARGLHGFGEEMRREVWE